MGRVFTNGKRLNRFGSRMLQRDELQVGTACECVDLVNDGCIKRTGAELVDEKVCRWDFDDHVFSDAFEKAGRFQDASGHETQGALFCVTNSHSDAFRGEVGEGFDIFWVLRFYDDSDFGFCQKDGLWKLFSHRGDKAKVAGVIDVREPRIGCILHGLHRGAEHAATIEHRGQRDALAFGKSSQHGFHGGPIDAATVEDEFGLVRPCVTCDVLEAVCGECGAAFGFRRKEAGESEGFFWLLARGENGDGCLLGVVGELWDEYRL